MHWFTLDWWKYLFEHYRNQTPTWRQVFCRARGHGDVVWYTMGFEPDMHCRRCGEDIG